MGRNVNTLTHHYNLLRLQTLDQKKGDVLPPITNEEFDKLMKISQETLDVIKETNKDIKLLKEIIK